MKLWPRRAPRERPDDDEFNEAWASEPDPRQAYWDQFGGNAPASLTPNGPARVYDDEIDEEWRDPWTELDEDDE